MKKVSSTVLAFGLALLLAGAVQTHETAAAPALTVAAAPAGQVTDAEDDEGGFDDWGLLGLLGLAGLLGLRRNDDRTGGGR